MDVLGNLWDVLILGDNAFDFTSWGKTNISDTEDVVVNLTSLVVRSAD
jgi:hypothetical protein